MKNEKTVMPAKGEKETTAGAPRGSGEHVAAENRVAGKSPELSVVIPVRNESENVIALLEEIEAALGTEEVEIIFVNDASADDTCERLQKAQLRPRPWLHVLNLREHSGQSAAIRVGVLHARAPWVVTLDGDGQNDPADIPTLVDARDRELGYDGALMICGIRARRNDTWVRRVTSRIANRVRRYLLDDDCVDTGCGLKLFPAGAFRLLPAFNHMHRFLPALIQRDGGRVVSVAVNHRPREKGRSNYGVHNRLWVGIIDLVGVMWLKRRGINTLLET